MELHHPPPARPPSPRDHEDMGALMRDLADDTRELAKSEIRRLERVAVLQAKRGARAAVFGGVALALGWLGLVATAVAAVLAMGPFIGYAVATGVVAGLSLLVAAGAAFAARAILGTPNRERN